MEMKTISPDTLQHAVDQLLETAAGRRKIAFYGEMGAGKTTFIKAFCKTLGVEESVTSPTFSLINEYSYTDPLTGETKLVHHLDLYRLKSQQEALDIGIEDYLYDNHYFLIEWPELIEELLPEETVKINIQILDKTERNILFL